MTDYKKVYEQAFGIKWDRKKYEVHHIDHDRSNNDIGNLILLPRELHKRVHSARECLFDFCGSFEQSVGSFTLMMEKVFADGYPFPNADNLEYYISVCREMQLWGTMKIIKYRDGITREPIKIEGIWSVR